MGLLDDAIREHLELKRRRGADPGEVERQENEALGAKQQAEFAQAPEAERDEPPAAAADEPALAADEPALGADDPDEPIAEAAEPVDAGEEREPFDVESLDRPPPGPDPEPLPEPQAAEPAPPEADPWLEEERDEVPADESLAHPREEGEEPGEDVLEDTPDFLQETPEHDRLWFEQRPPRDFDWDK